MLDTTIIWIFAIILSFYYLVIYITNKLWVFDKTLLQHIAWMTATKQPHERLNNLIYTLNTYYGGKVNNKVNFNWIKIGNTLWYYGILHVSLFESLIVIGTPLSSSGTFKRPFCASSNYILNGNIRMTLEQYPFTTIQHGIGTNFDVSPMGIRLYDTFNGVCMLEYKRGPVFMTLVMNILKYFISSLDIYSSISILYDILIYIILNPLIFLRLK